MRNNKDFQERYERWKNGENYWDIRGIDLPKYNNTNKSIYKREDGTYYSSPTNEAAFTENVVPLLKRDLSNEATWDYKGDSGKIYKTRYTDDMLKNTAMQNQPSGEFYTWTDLNGDKHREPRIVGMSGNDPLGQFVLDTAIGNAAYKTLFKQPLKAIGESLTDLVTRDFRFTKPGNWLANKIISRELNNVIDNTYKRFPTYNPSMFANNFILKQNGFGETELVPIINSQFDNYAHNIYTKLNRPVEYPEIRLVDADHFSPGVTGLYNYSTKTASISHKGADQLSTAIHEAISHHTDQYVENLPLHNFIPNINANITVGDVYRFLGQQGSQFHKLTSSSNWNEMRATLNELRGNSPLSKRNIDNVYNDEILTILRDINAYGQDYYNALIKSTPQNNNNWFDLFKMAWKYLPTITIPIINKNTNDK